jgi:dTDP-4-amino-4,6-dideoxygalactose transaminase
MTHSRHHIRLVDLQAQYAAISEELDAAMRDVVNQGIFIGGEPLDTFSRAFAEYAGAAHCVPCANGTDALELALQAHGIGRGQEVIVPAFSFVATMEAVFNAGATPVLCDIEPDFFSMDTVRLEALVTSRTRAIIPVHLYGQMADMDAIRDVARRHGLVVIEDAAQAHGATWRDKPAGSLGDAGCFSFYPGKNLGAYGDAGAIVTSDPIVAGRMRKLANHGRLSKYEHDIVGRNSRMDTLQAAILGVKLPHLDAWNARRRELAASYAAQLAGIREITCPAVRPKAGPVWHLYVIRVHQGRRDALRAALDEAGIETGIHYPFALNRLSATTGQLGIRVSCPQAELAAGEVLSLPLYPEMTESMLGDVVRVIRQFFND